MDRNTFTGLFLIFIILVGSTYFINKDSKSILDSKKTTTTSAKKAPPVTNQTVNAPLKIDSAILSGPFGAAHSGSNQPVVLENKHLKVNISPKGGRIESVLLKEFKTYDQKPLVMFHGDDNKFGLLFNAAGINISTNDLYFTPLSDAPVSVSNQDSASVTLRLTYAENRYIDYIYSIKGDSYKVDLTIATKGMQDVIAPAQQHLTLNWEAVLEQKEKDIKSEHRYSTAYYHHKGDEVDHLDISKDDKKELGEDGSIKWISFKQHFFSNVLIAKSGFSKGVLTVNTLTQPGKVKSFTANMELPFNRQDVNTYPMEFYFGPNKFSVLKQQGYDLEKQIDMGYWPLKYVNRFIVLPVFNLLETFNWSYGLIILVLTILLKLVLSPLTYKSYLSMAKMRVLKPEMDEIKAKVGEDNPTLLQQEYLKLYKKAGVNPLGGCIPMLLQLPIVMAFFFFFPNLFELRQESFLWMKDLSTYDALITFPTIPVLNMNHISLMCILMTISTLIYTYFNNQISGATGQMKYIGYISPIVFFGILNSYPSGLNYYYFLANMLTFGQQFLIRQMVNDEKIHARIQENKKKPESAKKKSGFQKRMEDYMRQQQQKGQAATKPATGGKKK
ncbi:membrane protein insertase YidC [Pedobacter sp. BS3]|uniref:membrane protein insertase YidC n=1 Tax=Pedobacter sp. BS3 TaxID=2567937 RepID=UPI0011EC12AD|nr:membrane protein insertase YidC [Pedobacter sp. BS3]TZF84570.1 membrane protein insertase YidC [Pedobacter sp. BS3]